MLTYRPIATQAEYIDRAWTVLRQIEGTKYSVYADSNGYASIGVGFNLADGGVRTAWRESGRGAEPSWRLYAGQKFGLFFVCLCTTSRLTMETGAENICIKEEQQRKEALCLYLF